MPTKAKLPLEQLLGGKIAPPARAQKGMKRAQQELARRFDARRKDSAASAEALSPLAEALGRQNQEQLQTAVRSFKDLDERARRRKLSAPRLARENEVFSLCPFGITRVPPFDYQWSWSASDNNAVNAWADASAASGQQSISLGNGDHEAHLSGAAAVGVYFRPLIANGVVHLSANPAIDYRWWTYCTLDSAHSDGWIGLYVGQYTLTGDLDRVALDQQVSLWSDDSWAVGAGDHSGSNSGYPLDAWFTVDSSHWYAMWVWTGGSVYGDGSHTFWGSFADSSLYTGTPSISIALY